MGTLKARLEMPWKLILDTGTAESLLFDLGRDPLEKDDLARRQPEKVGALAEALRGALPEQLRPVPMLPHEQVSDELRERLRALGYVE